MLSCSPSGSGEPREPELSEAPQSTVLVPTLRVTVTGGAVALDLIVANAGAEPVVLTFGTSQRYDFVVLGEDGAEVWRWSADRMFTQAVAEEEVPAGAALEYHEAWPQAGPGRFRVVATVESIDHPLELTAEFEVPAD